MKEMKEMKEVRYLVNDTVVDSTVFTGFLDYLRKEEFSYTYIESSAYDYYVQYSIVCRHSVFEIYQIHITNDALFSAGLKDKSTKLSEL